MNLCVIFVSLCLVSAAFASGNSLKDPYICGPPTCIKSEKFKYLQDIIYHYEYKVKVETQFAGSSNNRSTLDIKTVAQIQFLKPCEGLLQLTDVTLIDQDENYPVERAENFIHIVSQYELRFAFHDGIISELCPNEHEEDWVLNFKRGLLSLFQNSMKRFDINFKGVEQDVHGSCNVDYSVRGQQGTSLLLVKKRDLGECTNRYKYMSILQTVRYDFQSKFQTWPVLKSESKCVITVDHNVYKAVNCRERHLFEPFSGKNSGAMTTVIQDLALLKETNKTDNEIIDSEPKVWSVIPKRANLLHQHTAYLAGSTAELKSARDVLKLLCQVKDNEDDSNYTSTVEDNLDSGSTVGLWGRLVRASRGLHHAALSQLLARAPTICTRAEKHLLDALPYIASVGSVELIKDMVLSGKVDGDTRHEWLMSMAMIPRPKVEMLDSMLELLQKNKNDNAISFTASSMVHSYCRQKPSLRECCEEETPKQILDEFQSIVKTIAGTDIAYIDRKNRNALITAIKALGNIGGFKQEFQDVLINMIGDDTVPLQIRLAAVDAFRRTPCTETREYFLELFRNNYVDIEVRIAAYLQVMKCPNLSTVRKIFHSLENEKVNQAATFVWSHLNNLEKSSLPSRVEIQGLFTGNPMPQLEDSPDFRMFSRNYEQSVFFDQYNAGGNYEANVVFSPDSYIPRSVGVNLTVDMFGESINVLEVKARVEGFERYFEALFGNDGPLSKSKINEKLDSLRILRSLNDADEVRRKIDDLGYKNEALKHQFPMIELGFKVFGNEISYWSAEGDDEIKAAFARLNPQLRIMEILSGKEISYNKASLFLDTTFSVPTGCGLPMNMNLMGTSYTNTIMSGNVADGLSGAGNLDFEGKIRPSVAINIASTMSVSAGGLSTAGIRLSSRVYTATAVEARLTLRGLSLVRLDLSLPRTTQEIFATKSELIILHGDTEFQQQGLNKNRIEQKTCSWSFFDKAIGIKVCASYQFPNMTNLQNAPYFIMSGPAKYIISLEKADPSATNYVFQYKWDKNQTNNLMSFSFDTPESKEKRMFNAILSLSNTSSTALVEFQSASNTLTAKGLYKNLEHDKSIEASLNVDGQKQFETLMSVKRQEIMHGFVWLPHAYWVLNDERVAELSGSLKSKTKGGVTQWDVAADFQTKQLASSLQGYYTVNGPTHGADLQLDYEFLNTTKHTIKLKSLYSERVFTTRHDVYGELSMEFSAYPHYNFYSVLKNVKINDHLDIGFNVSASRELKNDPTLSFYFNRMDKLNGIILDTEFILKRPSPIKMKYYFKEIGSKYTVYTVLNFNPKTRDIIVSGYLYYPPGTQLYLDSELNMTLPTLHPCTIKTTVLEKDPSVYQVNANGIWITGTDFNMDAVYEDQSKTNMAAHRLKVLINSSHFKDISVDGRFAQDNRQTTLIGRAEYNDNKYRTLVRYVLVSERNFTTFAELSVNDRSYSVDLSADLNNNTNLNVDLHFDQLRDVHLSYNRWIAGRQKRFSAALNWDANRDPTQKISVDVQLDNKDTWHRAGYFTLYYPGRVVNGEFEFLFRDWFCQWLVRMGWSSEDNIVWRVKMYSEAHNETVYALLSSMTTPFVSWRDTSFNLMWRYHDNLQALNGSMNWQEEFLAFHLLADYLFKSDEFYGEINAVVNSTIPALPRAAAIARHRTLWKKSADTLLKFQYNEEGLLMINSSWAIDRGQNENNITGRVTLVTPFQGYSKGFLRTHFIFGHKRDMHGITYLDLEEKVLKIYVNGHMHRITNCMLVVNATSPAVSSINLMSARIGFVEPDRHLVAMLVTPNSTTGIEVLLKLESLQNFNVFTHIALPIQYLNRAMITAKRAPEEVDFRVGWSTMDFGFTGIWHWQSPINFVYLYKLYTPLEGFEENGLVLKNVYGNGLDTEVSMRLSKHKFGVAILLLDNGKGLLDVIKDKFQHQSNSRDMFIENFDTTAQVILDTLYYPTITFHAHLLKFVGIEQEDIMEMNATLVLPNKQSIVITDVFVMEESTVMRNSLNIWTPYQAVQELKSIYTVDVTPGEKINVTVTALLFNGSLWQEISSRVYYDYSCGEDNAYQSYISSLAIRTPLSVLPALDAAVAVRFEDALWKMSADIHSPAFRIDALGRLELDDPFVETSGSLNLTSGFLEDYFVKMEFKKDFSDSDNVVGGGIQVQQGEQNNYMFAQAVWHTDIPRHIRFKARGALTPVLPPSELVLVYTDDKTTRDVTLDATYDSNYYSMKANQRPSSINVAMSSPHEGFRAVKVLGQFENDDVRGTFVTDTKEYAITGKVLNRDSLELALQLVPKGQGETISVRTKMETGSGTYILSAQLSGGLQATLRANTELNDNYTDVGVKIELPQSETKEMYLKSRVEMLPSLRRVLHVRAVTPLKKIQTLQADADFIFGPKTGYLLCNYTVPDLKGNGDLKWSFLLGDLFIRAIGHQLVKEVEKSVDLDIFFGNRTSELGISTNNAGFRMDLDRIWQIGANTSFGYLHNERMNLAINAILPKPNVDVHTLYLDVVMGGEGGPTKTLDAVYKTDVTKIITGVKGNMLLRDDNVKGNASLLWTSNTGYETIDNRLDYRWNGNGSHYVDYGLATPLYDNEDTFAVKGSYEKDFVHDYQVIKGVMHRPGLTQIGELDIRYGGVRHTDGHFNMSTPFQNLPWLRSIFNINNQEEQSDNKVDLFWPNKSASINTTHTYFKTENGFTQKGDVSLAVPLHTKHNVNTQYYYVQGGTWSNGNATIDFDGDRFVKGFFKQTLGKSERGLDTATSDIQVENKYAPVGVKYLHEYDDIGNTDMKQATVFHLHNATRFNLTGKLDVTTYENGKNINLTAIHGNRTLTFENKYETIEKELKQGSKITWAADTWINYDIHVTNMSTLDLESQQLKMNVWYPLRTFNLVATYQLKDTLLDTVAQLWWNVRDENKTAVLRGKWDSPPMPEGTVHNVDVALSHPSFRKDVSLKGKYITTPAVMSNLSLELQYSEYENEYLVLKSILTDNSNGPIRDYRFGLVCAHPSTNLDVEINSDIRIHSRWYYFNDYYRFQKTLFMKKLKHNKLLVDLNKSAVRYERSNDTHYTKVNATWEAAYPEYGLRAWVRRPSGNDTGRATLSLREMRLDAHYNSTDDISYHVVGYIPDARSGRIDAWRNYDDVTTVDIASYIRLNHSRLLTSSILWRPDIFSEIKSQAVFTLKSLYSQVNDTLMIIKEAPMEAHFAIKNVWSDAEPRIREFIDDLNDLHVIKDDLDDFQLFLNASYNNNDFYVKDIVEFTYYVLDEMALTNHLENLPEFVNDMWGLMGNTSHSIKQSMMYVVDTIKIAYSNFLSSVNKFLEADFMELVSGKLEVMILQYDNFIRDIHMKFLDYWEATWVNATNRLTKYWHDILKSVEPLFFKMLHYTETFVFTLWKNIMDFFYNRTQELTDSPYFNYVSTFGHEMDKIYKDLMNNDLLTNIKKYTAKLWGVFWGKIEKYIPFKDEISQIYTEFKNSWEHFLQTPQVQYVKDKCEEAYVRLKWWYDYFLIGEALDKVGEALYTKLSDLSKTALQYEEMHRTPKTNFIFDPRRGEIRLEQKLPMSWHAFNRTPDYSEVAEYRAVRHFLDDWLVTNKSMWSYYYEIRPYMDINNVLPPFAGLAMMTGQGTLVTFDKRVFTISEPGTFLLAKDYRQKNFTVLMESNDLGRYNLVILTRRSLIHIDLYKEQVSLGNAALTLPAIVDEWIIDRQTDMIVVEGNNGLYIECNLLFRTCKLQVSGWYYANLGGLLGTYNNEQYDEMQLPNGTHTLSVPTLAHSWNLEFGGNMPPVDNHDLKNDTQCEKFFQNKVSPLHPCFSVISPEPFQEECLLGVDACALASAYMQLCTQLHVPTHVPDHCMQCTTPQGEIIEEGGFYEMKYVPQSTDVVFVVEAQYCNVNLRKNKNMDLFVEAFDSKLQQSGLSDNRYAIVGFGGSGVYRTPRALYVDNRLFTDATQIATHFDNFYVEKSDSVRGNRSVGVDMFTALVAATELPLRPGVPRIVLLLPCSDSRCRSPRLDYSTIYHNLMENSVTLHILMDDDFVLSKRRAAKYLFGVDNNLAYTNKDYERLVGDAALRKQVKLPKEKLGLCTSLALETNGSIFAGRKLSSDRASARRVSTVVGARAALTARVCGRAPRCECRDTRLHCAPCPDTLHAMELSFWNNEEIDDLIDMALDPSNLPPFNL